MENQTSHHDTTPAEANSGTLRWYLAKGLLLSACALCLYGIVVWNIGIGPLLHLHTIDADDYFAANRGEGIVLECISAFMAISGAVLHYTRRRLPTEAANKLDCEG
jgi:hypothetical protein